MNLDSNPTTEDNDNEEVCITINGLSTLNVANNGPFFDAFSETNIQTILSEVNNFFSVRNHFNNEYHDLVLMTLLSSRTVQLSH